MKIRIVLLVIPIAGLCLLPLSGCDADDPTCPTVPDATTTHALAIDVQPDWVDAGWTLLAGGDPIVGVGDTVLVFDSAAICTLRAVERDGLLIAGGAERILAPAAGDTLPVPLRYVHEAWQARVPGGASDVFHDAIPWTGGEVIVAGVVGGVPTLQRRDHAGEVVWAVQEPGVGPFHRLVTLDLEAPASEPAFLAIASGEDIDLSWRAGDGSEVAAATIDDLSLAGIAGGPDAWLVLGTGMSQETVYTALVEVTAGGEVSRTVLDGDSHRVGVGLEPKPGGGWWVIQTRDVGLDLGHYDIEILAFDQELTLISSRMIGSGEGAHGLGAIGRPDGGLYINYLSHDLSDDYPGTMVAAVSPSGQLEWTANLDEPGFDVSSPLAVADDGSLLLVGSVSVYISDTYSVRTVRVSRQGDFIDSQRLGSLPVRCGLRGGCELWDGGLLLCGNYNVWQSGQQEAWLIRLASPELGSFGWPEMTP
jgi:hypothetical protein